MAVLLQLLYALLILVIVFFEIVEISNFERQSSCFVRLPNGKTSANGETWLITLFVVEEDEEGAKKQIFR